MQRWTLADWESTQCMYTADLRMLETILLQVEQGLLPADATARLGYNWGPVLRNPAYACLWPELSAAAGPSLRKFIEDSTARADRFACRVELESLRETTILGNRK